MHSRALRYFDTVARCRSLRQAASRLHIAPTAISRQIDLLEHQLGAPLLERGPEGIRLTPAGELLAEQARRTLRDLERVEARIADLKGLHTGRVALLAAEGTVAGLLVPVLAELNRDYPRLTFEISTASAGGVLAGLRAGDADIGLGFFMPPREDIECVASAELEHCAVMAPAHPLAGRKRLTLAELVGVPLALPDERFGLRQALERSAKARKLNLTPTFATASLETQKALAMEGSALLLLPAMAVARECRQGLLVAVPLLAGELERARVDLCVYRHRTPSFAMQACQERLVTSMNSA